MDDGGSSGAGGQAKSANKSDWTSELPTDLNDLGLTFAFRRRAPGLRCPSPVPLARVGDGLLQLIPRHLHPHGGSAFVVHRRSSSEE